jgi:hypothetical protein
MLPLVDPVWTTTTLTIEREFERGESFETYVPRFLHVATGISYWRAHAIPLPQETSFRLTRLNTQNVDQRSQQLRFSDDGV